MRLLLSLLTFFASPAFAQTVTDPQPMALVCAYNSAVPSPSSGTFFYVQCDSTGKLITSGGVPGGTSGQVQYNNSGAFGGFTVGGDGTLNTGTGSLIVTKTNGVSFGTAAVQNTGTSGANIPLLNAANTWSAAQAFEAGLVTAPSLTVGAGQTGLYSTSATTLGIAINGVKKLDYGISTASAWTVTDSFYTAGHAILGGLAFSVNSITGASMAGSGNIIGWSSTSLATGSTTADTAFSRTGANAVALGNGTASNATGTLTLATLTASAKVSATVHVSTGTAPTGNTGTCTATNFTGGSTAGKFTAPTCAAGTIILSDLPTATNGYTCTAQDQSTPANTLKQTANTTTSVTFTATTTNTDVVAFSCMSW